MWHGALPLQLFGFASTAPCEKRILKCVAFLRAIEAITPSQQDQNHRAAEGCRLNALSIDI